jgi:carbon storage regulator
MLVLSRKAGEKLVIGDNVTVEVLRVRGNRVTLGLSAPAEISIMRSELITADPEQINHSDQPSSGNQFDTAAATMQEKLLAAG